MATITTSTDYTYWRVGVQLGSWSADGPITVTRVHADGTRHSVRGVSDVSGGAAFGWDYETPLGSAFHYEAYDGANLISSGNVTLTVGSDLALLTAPGMPTFGGPVLPKAIPDMQHEKPSTVMRVLGRHNPIILSDSRKAPTFKLELLTETYSDGTALDAMLDAASVLLLRMPGTRLTEYCYVAVSDVTEAPIVADKRYQWSTWSLTCTVTDAPVGGQYGDPTVTWQAVIDNHANWQDVVNDHAAWLDVLKEA